MFLWFGYSRQWGAFKVSLLIWVSMETWTGIFMFVSLIITGFILVIMLHDVWMIWSSLNIITGYCDVSKCNFYFNQSEVSKVMTSSWSLCLFLKLLVSSLDVVMLFQIFYLSMFLHFVSHCSASDLVAAFPRLSSSSGS